MKYVFCTLMIFLCYNFVVFAQDSASVFIPDTMTIDEVIAVKNSSSGKGKKDLEFVLSKTIFYKGLNYGIYWPDGTLVVLPQQFIVGTANLRKQDDEFQLSWFTKDTIDDVYYLFYRELPALKDTGQIPRYVSITPMIRSPIDKKK